MAGPSVGSKQAHPKDEQKPSFLSQPSVPRQKRAGTFPGSHSVEDSEERDEVFKSFSKLSLVISRHPFLGFHVSVDPWETRKWLEQVKQPKRSSIFLKRVMER